MQTAQIEAALLAQVQTRYPGILDITTGLIGHYKLDEGSGTTAIDASSNGNDGTLVGSPTPIHSTGIIDGALTFSGDYDRVAVTHPVNGSLDFDADNFSISFWFNSTAITDVTARLVGKINNSGLSGVVFFADSAGDVNFFIDDGTSSMSLFTSGLLDGNWHHVVGIRNGNNFALYADGLLADSGTASLGSVSNTTNLKLGASTSSAGDYDGLLDDVRLYDRALTTGDIDELFATGAPLIVDTTNDAADGIHLPFPPC